MSPIPIRHAATLLALRGDADVEVLLVKRAKTLAFMPAIWVFPGGAIDAEDFALDAADSPNALLRAAKRAALRESAEEVALDATAIGEPLYFSRWLTPKGAKRRYDTFFFLARVGAEAEVKADLHEIVESRWLRPQAALEAHRGGVLPMAPPTWWLLEALGRLRSWEAIVRWAAGVEVRCIEPTMVRDDGTIRVVAPEDLQMPGAPVSGVLKLQGGVWRPVSA